jgi:hypothetical protein
VQLSGAVKVDFDTDTDSKRWVYDVELPYRIRGAMEGFPAERWSGIVEGNTAPLYTAAVFLSGIAYDPEHQHWRLSLDHVDLQLRPVDPSRTYSVHLMLDTYTAGDVTLERVEYQIVLLVHSEHPLYSAENERRGRASRGAG